ncbi:unnamed protein product [Chondrus crispus]|uniref:Uncharacterized protein n=1 Tax=Chondrus crispus TaxID=2769 RepID=S0F2S6_CHOCR|nr:unnamed protein product [Chondrus crispus]CDF77380.1 unnamed protein product [Chondrus crispus]|eukprot:XP_005712254.1 unnamed protein product [Chondrus crispus]
MRPVQFADVSESSGVPLSRHLSLIGYLFTVFVKDENTNQILRGGPNICTADANEGEPVHGRTGTDKHCTPLDPRLEGRNPLKAPVPNVYHIQEFNVENDTANKKILTLRNV